MDVKLGDLDLIKRVDDSDTHVVKEIRAVSSISVEDERAIVELRIPGAEGSILQDLGRRPVIVSFDGDIQGEDAKTTLENLRGKFKSGKPLSFSSDLTGIAEVTQVLIDDLSIDESMGATNRFEYSITLREYIEPKAEEDAPPSQDEEAEDSVQDETDEAEGTINYITGVVLDEEGGPADKANVKITDEQGNEYQITTNEEGVYRKDDLEPGKYTVTCDAPGYEGMKREVEIKGAGGESDGGGEEEGGEEGESSEEGGEESGEEGGGESEGGDSGGEESGGEESSDSDEGE